MFVNKAIVNVCTYRVRHKDLPIRKKNKSCIQDTLKQYAVPVYADEVYSDYKLYETIRLTISDCFFYETLIMMLRGETVKYSKQNAKRSRTAENDLIFEIAEAEAKLSCIRPTV